MQVTDAIADMLTRIRNASSAKHDSVKIPASNTKKAIAQILVDEGYIKNYTVDEDGKYIIDPDTCLDCGTCAGVCPVDAPKG